MIEKPRGDKPPGRNAELLAVAVERLKHLTRMGEGDNLHGLIGVELLFRDGEITTVRRRIEGTER